MLDEVGHDDTALSGRQLEPERCNIVTNRHRRIAQESLEAIADYIAERLGRSQVPPQAAQQNWRRIGNPQGKAKRGFVDPRE